MRVLFLLLCAPPDAKQWLVFNLIARMAYRMDAVLCCEPTPHGHGPV